MSNANSAPGISEFQRHFLNCIRVMAWSLVLGSLLAIILGYGALPDMLPISRWHSAKKSWFLAVRVPLINLLSLASIEVLSRSVTRYRSDSIAIWVGPVLSITAGFKSVVESVEMLLLPRKSDVLFMVLVTMVLTGSITSLWLGRSLLKKESWKHLKTTYGEKVVLFALIAAILGLNVVLFMR
jgi:hypothetical protein